MYRRSASPSGFLTRRLPLALSCRVLQFPGYVFWREGTNFPDKALREDLMQKLTEGEAETVARGHRHGPSNKYEEEE